MGGSRLLWVSAEPPHFTRGGGAIRQAHLLAGLTGRFETVDVVLAGPLDDPRLGDLVSSVTELDVRPRRATASVTGRRLRDLWRVGGARLPAEVFDRRAERQALRQALSALMRSVRPPYDVVHVEHLGLSGVVPAGVGRIRSLGVQNVPSRMAEQSARLAPGRRQRLLLGAEAAAARRFQAGALAGADVLTVVSENDAAAMVAGTGYPTRVLVVPNGVDTAALTPSPLPGAPRLVFTGTLDYLPNTDGIAWFVEEVFPLVRAERPEASLDIVGRSPTPAVRALARCPGVSLHVDVADVAPYLAAARVAVVPLRIGTGSRLKVLEAMACGRPVAGTTIGLEGLGLEDDRHVLCADAAPALAAAVLRLCREERLATDLGRAGRELVEERYEWGGIGERFAEALAPGPQPGGR